MRRILIILMLVGLFASVALASDAAAVQAEKPAGVQKAPEAPPDGTLWRSMVGEKFVNKTGLKVDFLMDVGLSTNNTANSQGVRSNGNANFPNGMPGDTGFEFAGGWMFIHRDIATNIIPRITPTPGPVPKKLDWGFMAETVYGRGSQPCRMAGYDTHWNVNEPGATNPGLAQQNRQNFLCTPNVYGQVYLPILKGVAITAGRYGDGLGYEIPPPVVPGPNFFWSHDYAFYSQNWQLFGVLVSANLYRSPKNGYLAAEFGVNNGEQSLEAASGDTFKSFSGAVRWRSPHMSTWVDYNFRFGNGNVQTRANGLPAQNTDFGPIYLVQAPNGQMRQRHQWSIAHDMKKWRFVGEGVYGKQSGDGKATTLLAAPPPVTLSYCGVPTACTYTGASYSGFNGTVIYKINRKTAFGVRAEQFRSPDGIFLWPLTPVKGNLNDVTAGINYTPVKYIRLRPEIRYDWQSDNHGVNAFGTGNTNGKTYSSQVMAAIDMVIHF